MAHVNLGEYLVQQGRTEEATAHWQAALKIEPHDAYAYYDLGVAASHAGKIEAAIANYRQALECQPDLVKACNHLAWILATSPVPSLRDGPQAVALAERAAQLTHGLDPDVLSTLGAAYACTGRFPEAVAAIQRAQRLPPLPTNPALADSLQVQLKFYGANSTFRDLSLTNAVP